MYMYMLKNRPLTFRSACFQAQHLQRQVFLGKGAGSTLSLRMRSKVGTVAGFTVVTSAYQLPVFYLHDVIANSADSAIFGERRLHGLWSCVQGRVRAQARFNLTTTF